MKMNRKAVGMISSAFALSLMLTGCGKTEEFDVSQYTISESGTWTDGTYTESTKGKNGEFEVTVVISDGRLTEIKIGDNEETPDKGGVAISQLPEEMVEEQSVSVDAVSGATITSEAIKEAVAKCLEAASAEKEQE